MSANDPKRERDDPHCHDAHRFTIQIFIPPFSFFLPLNAIKKNRTHSSSDDQVHE